MLDFFKYVCPLFLQVQAKQRDVVQLQTELSQSEDRVFAMSEHMKNVQQELNQTQVGIGEQFMD